MNKKQNLESRLPIQREKKNKCIKIIHEGLVDLNEVNELFCMEYLRLWPAFFTF